jgi:hypothetical protein
VGSRPHRGIDSFSFSLFVRSFVSFQASLIAKTRRLRSIVRSLDARGFVCPRMRVSNSRSINLNIHRRLYSSINIHTLRTHTHTHTTDGLGLQQYATLQRTAASLFGHRQDHHHKLSWVLTSLGSDVPTSILTVASVICSLNICDK